jgi:DNA-binding LacI/PurR family transcriptional regulator
VGGYDNTALAAARHVDLTTVGQPRPEMGRTAVRLQHERLTRRREVPQHILVQPALVGRGTTAPPRAVASAR